MTQKETIERKQGKFYISGPLVLEDSDSTVKLFMEMEFLPLRVEYRADMNAFEYIGLSHMFKTITIGEMTPLYTIKVTTHVKEGKPPRYEYEVFESKEKS